MEDILASIRRIIAEDQSNGLGRGGLTGFSRRTTSPAGRSETPPEPVKTDALSLRPSATEAPATEIVSEPETEQPSYDHRLEAASTAAGEQDHVAYVAPVFAPLANGLIDDEDRRPRPVQHGLDSLASEMGRDSNLPTSAQSLHDETGELVSSATGASVTSSFQVLADSVLMQDPGLIERIMRETLRPMLKTWLDDHLPNLVERLVRAEIERVARGGRAH